MEMALNSARLFFQGKLFQDHRLALRQMAIAIGSGALLTILLAQALPLWIAALLGGAAAGALQPLLFKNLKYA